MATNQPLAQDVAVKSAEEVFQKASLEEKANPGAFLDAHQKQCEIIFKAQGFIGLAKATGLHSATIRGWARRRRLYTPRKRSKVAHSSPNKPLAASSDPDISILGCERVLYPGDVNLATGTIPAAGVGKIRLTPGPLPDACWEWTGARDKWGYGRIEVDGQNRRAFRFVHEILHGPIPEGLEPDHLCRNSPCVNPSHLELVPHRINTARGNAGQHLRQRTQCPKGHPYDAANTYVSANGKRGCLKCRHESSRKWRERQHLAQ